MESISPNIFVSNMTETIDFYKMLDFETTMTMPDTGNEFVWAMMVKGNVTFMFQTFDSLDSDLSQISRTNGGSLLLYIILKDIQSYFDTVKDKVTVLKGLEKTFYGATEFSILDNNNYVLTFAEHE